VNTLQHILMETLDQALLDHLETTKRFPLLEQMVESTCHRAAHKLVESARNQVREHLEMEEQHPYTQDEVLLQTMSRARFKSLRSDLELQLRLDQEGVVYDTQAIQAILDRVFSKHEGTNWMAEQMELVLSCYGQVATQRVLDRTPQICWQTCRNLSKTLAEELGCVTDDVLETCLWESPSTKKKFHDLAFQLSDLQKAMDVVKSMR
jgi:FKBP-type peptidyl-prolyl cis-trans isomerase (trigger factor)